ncbi:MAG: oxidase [Acidobacteria bacterium]|nr:MAG: oxidase [Acidobacteriota bacterium]
MDAHAAHDDIRSHVKTYYMVFGALMVLTGVTVGVSYLHLSVPLAITVALMVAIVKGSLVALFFMHLSNERKIIYWALALTVVFFIFVMFVPLLTNTDRIPGTFPGTVW